MLLLAHALEATVWGPKARGKSMAATLLRIAVVTEGLKRMGADIQPTDDGMIIHGGRPLHGAEINSYLDHRIAMSFAVAGTICDGTLTIKDGDCVKISYPEFYEDLYSLDK